MGNLSSSGPAGNKRLLGTWPTWKKALLLVLVVGGLVALVLGVSNRLLQYNREPALELVGVVLPKPRPIAPFELVDHRGQPFDVTRFKGRWTFMFFGYTHCPDICPVAMKQLGDVFAMLSAYPAIQKDSQGVFVSLDPKRDTQAVLKDYVPFFNENFIGVTGATAAINAFTKGLGVVFNVSPPDNDGSYQLSHTSAFYLINPEGHFVALFQPQYHDVEKIVDYYLTIRGQSPKVKTFNGERK